MVIAYCPPINFRDEFIGTTSGTVRQIQAVGILRRNTWQEPAISIFHREHALRKREDERREISRWNKRDSSEVRPGQHS